MSPYYELRDRRSEAVRAQLDRRACSYTEHPYSHWVHSAGRIVILHHTPTVDGHYAYQPHPFTNPRVFVNADSPESLVMLAMRDLASN